MKKNQLTTAGSSRGSTQYWWWLKQSLPKFVQYVPCSTRGNRYLDQVYTTQTWRAVPSSYLGQSNPLCTSYSHLHPSKEKDKSYSYRTAILSQTRLFLNVNTCSTSPTLLSFIKFCMDTDKCICFYGLEIQTLVTAIKCAFRFEDSKIYISAGADLSRGIKMATENYTNMMEDHLSNNKCWEIGKIPKQLTNFKGSIARTFRPDSGCSLPGMSPQKPPQPPTHFEFWLPLNTGSLLSLSKNVSYGM